MAQTKSPAVTYSLKQFVSRFPDLHFSASLYCIVCTIWFEIFVFDLHNYVNLAAFVLEYRRAFYFEKTLTILEIYDRPAREDKKVGQPWPKSNF